MQTMSRSARPRAAHKSARLGWLYEPISPKMHIHPSLGLNTRDRCAFTFTSSIATNYHYPTLIPTENHLGDIYIHGRQPLLVDDDDNLPGSRDCYRLNTSRHAQSTTADFISGRGEEEEDGKHTFLAKSSKIRLHKCTYPVQS